MSETTVHLSESVVDTLLERAGIYRDGRRGYIDRSTGRRIAWERDEAATTAIVRFAHEERQGDRHQAANLLREFARTRPQGDAVAEVLALADRLDPAAAIPQRERGSSRGGQDP